MEGVQLFLRNSNGYNAIICRYSDTVEFHTMRVNNYFTHEQALQEVHAERPRFTNDFINDQDAKQDKVYLYYTIIPR